MNGSKDTTRAVLIVEDHDIYRAGLKTFLEASSEWTVAGEARDVAEAVAFYKRLKPDAVLLDLSLPDKSGAAAAATIMECDAQANIVALTAHHEEEFLRKALQAGVRGYVLKDAPNEQILLALRHVVEGMTHLCPEVTQMVVRRYLSQPMESGKSVLASLTQRELDVLTEIARGRRNDDIANRLFISLKTVEKHKFNIARKLGLESARSLRSYLAQEAPWFLAEVAGKGQPTANLHA